MEVDDTVNLQVVILPKENVAVSEVTFPIPKQFIQSRVLKSNTKMEDLEFRLQKNNMGIWEFGKERTGILRLVTMQR